MITHCSKIDESFVDYLGEQDALLDTQRYANVLNNLVKGKKNQNNTTGISCKKSEKLNNFVVYFDQSLFEAPPIILKLEEELAQNESEGAYKK
jgi:hypothetical protein